MVSHAHTTRCKEASAKGTRALSLQKGCGEERWTLRPCPGTSQQLLRVTSLCESSLPSLEFSKQPMLSKADDSRKIFLGLSFANHLLGDSAPLHPPGTCLPTLALRRDTCLKRTHPSSQCTPHSGVVRFCSPNNTHPLILGLTPCPQVSLGS